MDVSVVIPSYKSERTIGLCLTSLRRQETSRSYEVIVVDSSDHASTDMTKEFPEVRLIRLGQRTSAGAARNIGAAAASGEVVCLIDADCEANPDWIEKMAEAHETGEWAAVGGSIENAYPESAVGWASYMTQFSEYVPQGPPRSQALCVAGNLSVRRSVYLRRGGFREGLAAYDDVEFCRRLMAAGERLLFRPDIRVRHRHRTLLAAYARREVQRGRGAVAIRRAGLLPGKRIARSRILGLAAAPAAMVWRMWADLKRLRRSRFVPPGRLLSVLPLFVAGSCCWTAGFAAEALIPTMDVCVAPPATRPEQDPKGGAPPERT